MLKTAQLLLMTLACCAAPSLAQMLTHEHEFLDDPGNPQHSYFGRAIAIAGNCVLIGAPEESLLETEAGAVYVFDLASGDLIRKLTAPEPRVADHFGKAIDAEGDLAIIGMSREAMLMRISTGEMIHLWSAESDSFFSGEYGATVAIEGDRVLIGDKFWSFNVGDGGNGSAFVYDTTTGEYMGQLQVIGDSGGYQIGTSIDVRGDFALLGAPGVLLVNGPIPTQGGALLYNLRNNRYMHAYLDTDPNTRQYAGADVALLEDRVIVGAPGTTWSEWNSPGSVLIYDRQSRELIREIKQTDSNADVYFGASIAVEGELLVVGAPYFTVDGQYRAGKAYVYNHVSGDLLYTLQAEVPVRQNLFAQELTIGSGRIVSGRVNSAFSFRIPDECPADRTNDGVLNFFDISDFIIDYQAQSTDADLVHDGELNAFDVLAYIASFSAGCP